MLCAYQAIRNRPGTCVTWAIFNYQTCPWVHWFRWKIFWTFVENYDL